MKIAHLNILDYLYVGIEKKLLEQAKAAKESNLDIDYIILNNEKEIMFENVIYKKLKYPNNKIISKLKKRFFKFSIINDTIDLSSYDSIVIRYPRPVYYDYKKLVNKYENKLITEHHAIALPETIQNITFGNILNFFQELLNSRLLKKKLIGLIGVTDEITRVESYSNTNLKTKTISNGINVLNVNFTKFLPFNDKDLILTIVASEYAPWHGLDKLLYAIKEYKGEIKIIVNIVGEYINDNDLLLIKDINKNSKNNIRILGSKRDVELDQIMTQTNIALGSLAIYRQKLNEACALKVREYLARGIPFVYTAPDPDVSEDFEFALQLPNDKTPINLNHIIDFSRRISQINNASDHIREYALNTVDWKIKVKEMSDFIVELNKNKNKYE